MDFDEHLMMKAFEKCFDLLEKIDARLNSLEKREFGLDGERLLDNQDLCQLLNVDKKTLERYRRSGRLPFLKLCGKIFYKYSSIVKEMQNLKMYDFDRESEEE
ncbi:helix-turn-helix domain-containing protein [Butyricimonas virosa]|jgi:hypothetical protein bacD2_01328|uniref:helix-turn-helix domain-containing protein n=1 Tax=Butyricimonas virosa TaxID=544645 RepID=UPI00242D5747|nr:helix-turn-helix domain-containing protein [Butyricimonas virosa]MDY5535528.1 helix-turn-helix domain-containing protein [Butyricimonas virosa]